MKNITMKAEQFVGYAVSVKLADNLEQYAKDFLHIFNNVREASELLAIRNYDGSNCVTVYCEPDSKDDLIAYLENFGEIKRCEEAIMLQVDECTLPDYDFVKYHSQVVVQNIE